jgi:exodeoxyribonuclease-1
MLGDSIIYDTENSSLNRKFGQITQYGGIRVASDLQIKEEQSLDIRLLPWVVPSPGACRVTKVGPEELTRSDRLSEFNAAKRIYKFMEAGYGQPINFITYNGLEHDDKFLREMFFRNLHDPWFTSGALKTRIDLFPLVQLIHAVDKNALVIPTNEAGKFSYKLDRVAPANGIALKAHDGLGDAHGCLDLVKIIIERAPWAWELAQINGRTANATNSIQKSIADVKPLWLFTHFGEPEFIPVLPVAVSGKDAYFCVDLRSKDYREVFKENKDKLLFKGSCFHRLEPKRLPIFLDEDLVRKAGIEFDAYELLERAEEVNGDVAFKSELKAAVSEHKYPTVENEQSEDKMFPFMTNTAKSEMRRFIDALTWEERLRCRFTDLRNRDFAARIILDAHLHGDAEVSEKLVRQVRDICQPVMDRPFDGVDARWVTLSQAMADKPDQAWLDWARDYYGEDPRLAAAPVVEEPGNAEKTVEAAEPENAPQLAFTF